MEDRLDRFDDFITGFIINFFGMQRDKMMVILSKLSLDEKVDLFEYVTKTPVLEHKAVMKEFELSYKSFELRNSEN